jgi:SAM-dependent methyltransferase
MNSTNASGPQSLIDLERRLLEPPSGVIETIAEDDEMYAGNRIHYFDVGNSALRCVRSALFAAGRPAPTRVLDLPCGHGRVLRTFKAAWPSAQFTACDVLRTGVDYCARTFGATPVYAERVPERTQLPGRYDLIWCGSLLTHFDLANWESLMRLFLRVLEPGGLLVATVQGRRTVDKILKGNLLGLKERQARELLEGYAKSGFAYQEYEHIPGYGLSLSSGAWSLAFVQRYPELRTVGYTERGWDDHQDALALQRVDAAVQAENEAIARLR